MDTYIFIESIRSLMAAEGRFLAAHLRAFAGATEVEERVLAAVRFASGAEDVSITRTTGHFGNPIIIFEAEHKKARDIRRFLEHLDNSGIRAALAGQAEARVDGERVFHFRLDKQQAYLGKLVLATGRDVIDVHLKVGAYPATREAAVRAVSEWLGAASP